MTAVVGNFWSGGVLVSKSAFLEIFIITGLKSDVILSFVDRNVAIFTTQHAIMHYEIQVSQGKL